MFVACYYICREKWYEGVRGRLNDCRMRQSWVKEQKNYYAATGEAGGGR